MAIGRERTNLYSLQQVRAVHWLLWRIRRLKNIYPERYLYFATVAIVADFPVDWSLIDRYRKSAREDTTYTHTHTHTHNNNTVFITDKAQI